MSFDIQLVVNFFCKVYCSRVAIALYCVIYFFLCYSAVHCGISLEKRKSQQSKFALEGNE